MNNENGRYHHQFFFNPYKEQLKALEHLSGAVDIDPTQLERLKVMSEDVDKQLDQFKRQIISGGFMVSSGQIYG